MFNNKNIRSDLLIVQLTVDGKSTQSSPLNSQ